MPDEQVKLYGFYSEKMARKYGTYVYTTPEGEEIEVTEAGRNPEHGMGWDDVQSLGEVVKHIRRGRKGERTIHEEQISYDFGPFRLKNKTQKKT